MSILLISNLYKKGICDKKKKKKQEILSQVNYTTLKLCCWLSFLASLTHFLIFKIGIISSSSVAAEQHEAARIKKDATGC